MKKILWILCVSAVLWPQTGWTLDACEQDRPKACAGVTPGKGAVHNCMLANMGKLSSDCKATVQNSENLVQQFIQTCTEDTRRFCAVEMDLRPDNVIDCMKQNKEKYSSGCKRIYRQLKAYEYPILQ
jgi:hypothetical protein